MGYSTFRGPLAWKDPNASKDLSDEFQKAVQR